MKVKVCQTSEVPPDGMTAVEVSGKKILIANVQDTFYAMDDTCSHAQGSLSEGYLDVDECTVECPLHSAVFSLTSGEVLEPPAEDDLTRYDLTVEGDDIYIDVGE
jgi:3-phenylpropionate/trans-cinnamate dioxygenase ferredoxin subunit